MLIPLIQRHWALLTALLLVLISVLSLSPASQLPTVPGTDKTHHFIAYAACVFPLALRRPRYWLWLALAIIGWSGMIELIQPYVNRYGEWLDLAANSLGVLIGIILATLCRLGLVKNQ